MMTKVTKQNLVLFIFIVLSITNCKHKQNNTGPLYSQTPSNESKSVYSFAIHPLYNPEKLMQAFNPLISYMNTHIKGATFTLEASRDYYSYERKYLNKKPDFLLPNPWQTIQAIKAGYHVILMAGEPSDFKGIFIIRKDSYIKTPKDLIGKTVSYPASTALAACIMPQYFLYRSGININTEIDNHYVGSQESSIMNVYLRMSAVSATWPPPWRAFKKDHPKEASELKVAWETESLVNNSVMVRNNIPMDIQEQVSKLLSELHTSAQGRVILTGMETARFIKASNKDYDVVRLYIEQFEKKVRKIETQ